MDETLDKADQSGSRRIDCELVSGELGAAEKRLLKLSGVNRWRRVNSFASALYTTLPRLSDDWRGILSFVPALKPDTDSGDCSDLLDQTW